MPGMNAVGTNTAHSVRAMAMRAVETSFIVWRVASRGPRPRAMFRSTFSTTTIASSTTMPTARTTPKSEKVVDGAVCQRQQGERADKRDRYGNYGNDRRTPALQEEIDDPDYQKDRDADGLDDLVYGLRDESRRIVDVQVIDTRGESSFSNSAILAQTAFSTPTTFASGVGDDKPWC